MLHKNLNQEIRVASEEEQVANKFFFVECQNPMWRKKLFKKRTEEEKEFAYPLNYLFIALISWPTEQRIKKQ